MLHEKVDSEKYKAELIKKFSNFCEKAPVLLSYVTDPKGVTVIHTNSGTEYHFPWSYTTPVKTFIHDIKVALSANHYPRLEQVIKTEVNTTVEEQAAQLAEGVEPDAIAMTKVLEDSTLWRIDRVIVWRDIFILVDEETEKQYRYHMNKSCVFFLKDYRNGKYTTKTAADYFFKHSDLMNALGEDQPG